MFLRSLFALHFPPFSTAHCVQLCNLWYARSLARRLQAEANKAASASSSPSSSTGTGITVVSVHPGAVQTEIGRYSCAASFWYCCCSFCMRSPSQVRLNLLSSSASFASFSSLYLCDLPFPSIMRLCSSPFRDTFSFAAFLLPLLFFPTAIFVCLGCSDKRVLCSRP